MPYLRQPDRRINPFALMAEKYIPEVPITERVQKIIDDVEAAAKTLPRSDTLALAARMFEHSPEDGLKLAERLRLTPHELLGASVTPGFALKHRRIFQSILTFTSSHGSELKAEDVKLIERADAGAETSPQAAAIKLNEARSRKIFKAMEDAYADLIRQRQFKAKPAKKNDEEFVDRVLAEAELALQDSYYAGPIKKKLLELPPQQGKAAKSLAKWQEYLRLQSIVTSAEIHDMCRELELDAERLKHDLRRDKYVLYKPIYGTEKVMVERQLKQDIDGMISEDKKVALNIKTGKYEIKDREVEAAEVEPEVVEPKVVERKNMGFGSCFISQNKLYFYTEEGRFTDEQGREYGKEFDAADFPVEINGKLYFRVFNNRKYFIANEQGQRFGEEYFEALRPTGVNGKLYFKASKGDKEFIANEQGQRFGEVYDVANYPTEVNGKLYFNAFVGDRCFIANEQGQRFGEEYDVAYNPFEVNGKLYFKAGKGSKKFIANEDGEKFGEEYDDIEFPAEVNGKLYFIAEKDGKRFVANQDGQKFGEEYDGIESPAEVNGKLYFIAEKDGKKFVANQDGQRFGEEYERISGFYNDHGRLVIMGRQVYGELEKCVIDVGGVASRAKQAVEGKIEIVREIKVEEGLNIMEAIEVNGQLRCMVNKNGQYYVTDENGKKLSKTYEGADTPVAVNGKLFFRASDGRKWFITNEQGDRIGEEYDDVESPVEVNGELYFRALKGSKSFIANQDGQRFGEEYDRVDSPVEVNGKLYFVAGKGVKQFIANQDGQRFGEEYAVVDTPTEVNGKLYFAASKNGKTFITNQDGQKFGEKYVYLQSPTPIEINGKLYFIARKGGKSFVTNQDGQKFGEEYDDIGSPIEVNGKLYYRASVGRKDFIVNEDGQKFGEEYDWISGPKEVNGQLCFLAVKDNIKRLVFYDVSGQEIERQAEERLELLNLVHDPNIEGIEKHFASKKEPGKEEMKDRLGSSAMVVTALNQMIKEMPEWFLRSMGARRDRAPEILADRLISKIFPEAYFKSRHLPKRRGMFDFLGGGKDEAPEFSPEDYLMNRDTEEFTGGGAEHMDDNRVIMEFREPMLELIVTGMFGEYNPASNQWKKTYVPLRAKPLEPIRENTITLPHVKPGRDLMLPKSLDASLVTERVRGLKRGGKEEVELKTETDSLGESMVRNLPKVDAVAYTIAVGAAAEPMAEIDADGYRKFAAKIAKAHSPEFTRKLANLPEETDAYLASPEFTRLSPKGKVKAIEKYVRSLGFYDVDNQEVSGLKKGKPLEDRMMIAEMRLEELRGRHPEMASEYEGRKFAGVCTDFAEITCAILRRAGFMAGMAKGVMAVGKQACVKHSHAAAFVIWPDALGQSRAVIVDGTPGSNDPRLRDMSMPTLEDRERLAEEAVEAMVTQAEAELEQILGVVGKGKVQDIRKLENGKLEQVLNVILTHKVKQNHLEMLTEALNFYWYGGINKMEDMVQDMELKKTMEDYLVKQREQAAGKPAPETHAGTKLFALVEDFVRRFRQGGKKNTAAALKRLDRVLALSQNSLEPIEAQAMAAIVTYLEAKNMAGK